MVKGVPVNIAGSVYPRKKKAGSVSRKRKVAPAYSRLGRKKVSGEGDYSILDDKGQMIRTPFAHSGRDIGQYFFGKTGGDIGFGLGHAMGRVFGSGDYHGKLDYNVLVNSTQVPEFTHTKQTHIVTHREYIQDITTSSSAGYFKSESFAINPAQSQTFPWLASIAESYEQYRIHGMIFQFVTTSADALNSTNTALGTVIMATDYNPSAAPYPNKQAMENSQYASSAKPSMSQMHGIECAPSMTPVSQLFCRSGSLPSGQDLRWYDLGNFQLATTGFQGTSVVVGELWVTYVIEFFKPQIPATIGGNIESFHRYGTSAATANPFGSVQVISTGSIAGTVSGTTLTLPNINPGVILYLAFEWYQATGTVTAAEGTITVNKADVLNYFVSDTVSSLLVGFTALSAKQSCNLTVKQNLSTKGDITIIFAGFTVSSGCDVFVTQLDATITG